MNENILDQPEESENQLYFKKSKANLKVASTLIFTAIAIVAIVLDVTGISGILLVIVVGPLLIGGSVFGMIGTINGIKSYLKKEDPASFRFLVLIGNLLIASAFVYVIVLHALSHSYIR